MKRLICLFVSALCCSALFAAQLTRVSMYLGKEDCVYSKGEKVVVTAKLTEDCTGPLFMYVLLNGTKVLEKDVVLGPEASVVYEASFDRPVFGMVYIQEKGGKSDTGIGFAVAPEEMHPGFRQPSDYRKFWKKELKAMRAVKPEVKLTEVESGDKDFVCYDFEISMHEGWPARGYLAMPRGAELKSLPIVMYFHGAGVKSSGSQSKVKTALSYAKMGGGCIAVDVNAHGMLNGQPQKYYDDLEKNELKDYRCRPFTTKEDFYYKDMMLRDVRTLDWLCTLKEWDGRRVLVTGSSQGGNQSLAVAGLDRRVSSIVAIVPGYCDMGAVMDEERQSGWKRMYRDVHKYPGAEKVLPYFDNVFSIRYTKAELWMELGLIDQTCAAEGMYAAFNNARMKHKRILLYPGRRHSMKEDDQYYNDWYESIGKAREEYLESYLAPKPSAR